MKAIQFDLSIPRYVASLALSKVHQPVLWGPWSCVVYRDVPEPKLPNDEWVLIRTRFGGICGSDIHHIHLGTSPGLSAITSFPFTFGHENCGTVERVGSAVTGWKAGDRVVVEPNLWCKPRCLPLCGPCSRGDIQLCERLTEGCISAGPQIGSCRDTGGSWSPFFVAHESQLVRVPGHIGDENAVLAEPFATSLHAVLANRPNDGDTVLVIGAGTIGLGVIAALRAIGSKARVIVAAKHRLQKELAHRFGADLIIEVNGGDYGAEIASALGATRLKPLLGKPVVFGGAEVVFECVGSGASIDDAIRFAGPRGRVIIAGLASLPKGIDWSAVWLKELDVRGTYTYGHDSLDGHRVRTFDLALDLMNSGKVDLATMVTHRFPLAEYARAFEAVGQRGKTGLIKAVFEF